MRYYLIDELNPGDVHRVAKSLDDKGLRGPLEGIYYLPVDEKFLTDDQREHLDDCGPYFMALEVEVPAMSETGHLRMEMLVRARNRLRCGCLCYAAPGLREHMVDYLDTFVRELDISV